MSAEIHQMGYNLGLWETLWINKDANNFSYAESHGYLLKSKADPSQVCLIPWWDGPEGAGIVDLANPAARDWFAGQLKQLESTYDVNGFKFDTRFFDPSCQPDAGYTANDYLKLGAQFTSQFDQQGVGVRISWTGSQKYGFVTRQIDKGTGWDSLQAAVAQNLAISTIGYPFVETDMIGGSLGQPPPVKDVLIRWAQVGDSLLAAPVLSDATSRDIHLPPGRWYDVANHRVLTGPADLSGYSAGLAQTPMFVRLGTPGTGKLMSALSG